MMLTKREEFYVLHNDHVVVGLLEKGASDDGFPVLEIALGEELHGFGHPLRGFEQPFPGRVFPQQFQDGLDVLRNLLRSFCIVFFNFPVCHGLFFVAMNS